MLPLSLPSFYTPSQLLPTFRKEKLYNFTDKTPAQFSVRARDYPQGLGQNIWSLATSYFWTSYKVTKEDGSSTELELNISSISEKLGVHSRDIRQAKYFGVEKVSELIQQSLSTWNQVRNLIQDDKQFNHVVTSSKQLATQVSKRKDGIDEHYHKKLQSSSISLLSNGDILIEKSHATNQSQSLEKRVYQAFLKSAFSPSLNPVIVKRAATKSARNDLIKERNWAQKLPLESVIRPLFMFRQGYVTSASVEPQGLVFGGEKHIKLFPNIQRDAVFHLAGAAQTLNEMHKEGITHGDIKPSNVLMKRLENNCYRSVLIDLAGAFKGSPLKTSIHYTSCYLPPEAIRTEGGLSLNKAKIGKKSDIWAFGLLTLSAICHCPLSLTPFFQSRLNSPEVADQSDASKTLYAALGFTADYVENMIDEWIEKNELYNREEKKYLKLIISGCLDWDPDKRIDAPTLLGYFTKVSTILKEAI